MSDGLEKYSLGVLGRSTSPPPPKSKQLLDNMVSERRAEGRKPILYAVALRALFRMLIQDEREAPRLSLSQKLFGGPVRWS